MLAYTSQILLENAYESWQNAIQYAQYLYDGLATLNNKKDFVASLHNAVELFLKQIMINNNDHRVASIKSIDPDGEPLKSFYNSIDLNKYFIDTPSETRRKFYSIEFKDLLDRGTNPIYKYVNEDPHITELKLLNKLRNDETHFVITSEDFLSDKEFEKLYNLMIDLYSIFRKAYLFHSFEGADKGLWDMTYIETNDRYNFERMPLNGFSFKEAIMKNPITTFLREHEIPYLPGINCDIPELWTLSIAQAYEKEFSTNESYKALESCLKTMDSYKLIRYYNCYFDESSNEIIIKKGEEIDWNNGLDYYTSFSIKR